MFSEKDLRRAGIYVIKNTENSHRYIGQSFNIADRWKGHKYNLRRNKHYNKYLQNAWNKYGEECFMFQVLEFCQIGELDEKEQLWIIRYNPEYNLVKCLGNQNWMSKDDELEERTNQDENHHFLRPEWHRKIYGRMKK